MQFHRPISTVLLIALLAWSVGGVCAPGPSLHGMQCLMDSVELAVATHGCCPPEKTMAMSCHGKRNDAMARCVAVSDDEAIVTTSKYRDEGKACACASVAAADLIASSPEVSRARAEDVPLLHTRAVLDTKADLRI